jgi:glycosyltransferase involved in cell wall biosynthesis
MHPPHDRGFEQLRQKAKVLSAPLLSVHDRGPWDWLVFTSFLNICRQERVQIWHGHDYKSNVLGLLLRRFWPMHLVTTVHGWGVKQTPRTWVYNKIDRLCLPHYDQVICVSPDLHAECLACGVPAERCVLIENAIDTKQFERKHSIDESKCKLGFTPGRLLVGGVGRLSQEKGFVVLIQAVAKLIDAGIDIELILIGEGEQEPELRRLIARVGHGDRIRLLGFRADTRELYEAMDIFALSSFREGLPNALLEAMSMEVPIVATRVAGVPRLIGPELAGLLVEPGDQEGLAGALTLLAHDASLRGKLRAAGRRTVEERYSFDVRMRKVRAIYDAMLASRLT